MDERTLGFRTKTKDNALSDGTVQNAEFRHGGAVAWVDFHDARPMLAVGRVVVGEFHHGTLNAPLEAHGRVVQRLEGEGSCSYQIRFGDPVGAALTTLANRRSAVRVRPHVEMPVHVKLTWPGNEVRTSAEDISGTGVAVLVNMVDEARMFRVHRFDLAIEPPAGSKPIKLSADVRHRSLVGSSIRYGIEFESGGGDFEKEQRLVVDYVMQRQAELLRFAIRGDERQ
jgi:hypothetical protein